MVDWGMGHGCQRAPARKGPWVAREGKSLVGRFGYRGPVKGFFPFSFFYFLFFCLLISRIQI
jgi:hypothetical protein